MATFGKVPADKHNITTTTIAAASAIIQYNNDIKIYNRYVMRLYSGDCGGGFLKNEDTSPIKRIRYGVGTGWAGGLGWDIRSNSVVQAVGMRGIADPHDIFNV